MLEGFQGFLQCRHLRIETTMFMHNQSDARVSIDFEDEVAVVNSIPEANYAEFGIRPCMGLREV